MNYECQLICKDTNEQTLSNYRTSYTWVVKLIGWFINNPILMNSLAPGILPLSNICSQLSPFFLQPWQPCRIEADHLYLTANNNVLDKSKNFLQSYREMTVDKRMVDTK
ncbi:uncharacterized protein LOC134255280 [Saccostrea cucullata]|uniref:uncharacterized protein LOC134255280 n=1 Tax=Saccostrea cuccullata TaxID=36930 RepID=UPI002ED62B03